MLKIKWVLGILAILALVFVANPVLLPAQAAEPPEKTEELQQWVYEQGYNYEVAENWITQLSTEERVALFGYRQIGTPRETLPENLAFVADVPTIEMGRVAQPSSYDAMALGYVTPVRDQASCGSCWIFGATADFESDVAIGENSLLDFAEQEVGDCNIWSSVGGYDFCNGGIALMTTNYFTKYGSAYETCNPYAATPGTCQGCTLLKNVSNWRMITGSDGETQITAIKNAIMAYGPVSASMYAGDAGFSAYSGGVYEYWGTDDTNHAVEIIGWDDTLVHSQGTGAWLIKNSWGTTWGASGPYPGCAWVAYGSANLGDNASAICGYEDPPAEMFYHDECGWLGYSYGSSALYAYGAVRFTPSYNETLTAVDFWAVDTNMSYEIKIFDTLTDLGGGDYSFGSQLGTTQTGTTVEQGYYSIPLDTPVALTSGDDFIVQVKLTNSFGYPIPVDYHEIPWLPDWSSVATFSGESYFSSEGTTFTKEGYDFGIRARANGTGLLRVQTSPATQTTISVDGIPRNDWSLDWVKMPAGEYMLSFSDVAGYATPTEVEITYYPGGGPVTHSLSEPIEILPDTVTEVIVNFTQLGNLWVETSPAVQTVISLDGSTANSWGFWTDLLPGDYYISVTDVVAFATPVEVEVTYPGQSAIIQAISEPIAVYAGGTTHVVLYFAQLGNLWVETSPALPATIFLDGNPMNDWSFWVSLEPGEYTVSFEDIDGYITPDPVVVTINPGEMTHVIGEYVSE